MNLLLKSIFNFIKSDFNLKTYFFVGTFLSITIYLNYCLLWDKGNFEDSILDTSNKGVIRHIYYLIFYGLAYYGTCLIVSITKNNWNLFYSAGFWLSSLFGLVVMSIDGSFTYTRDLTSELVSSPIQRYLGKILSNGDSIITIFLPLFLFYLFKKETYDVPFFGLHNKNVKWKPYIIITLIMSFLIFIISFDSGFQQQYPAFDRYDITKAENSTLYIWIFELVYGLDFISVELLFRGLFVIGLSTVIGKEVILPIVVTYAFLHYGKPMAECISSIFGGYLLSILALLTRNIWGGVIVHMGTAWLMELMAFLQGLIHQD